MSFISDKIAEVRGQGHVVPEGIEELFLAIEAEIGLKDKQPKEKPALIEDKSNTLNGERTDS